MKLPCPEPVCPKATVHSIQAASDQVELYSLQ